MYQPAHFRVNDRALLVELMQRHPFGTVVGVIDGAPEIAHLPLLGKDAPLRVQGHVARGNPLVRLIDAGAPLTAVFHGPHAYVSPRLYRTTPNVPTWNYAVVHARGPARRVDASLDHLRELAATFEAGAPEPWTVESVAEHAQRILPGLVAFEISVVELDGKLKLNQNRKPEDWAGVVEHLSASSDPALAEMVALMRRIGPPAY
jgi:transcriptional regulator